MKALIPLEVIEQRILLIRGQRVMLSTHLAELYNVETRVLNQAVKRNISRFPEDFMFQLNSTEAERLVSQNVIPHKKYFGGALPYAFTPLESPAVNSWDEGFFFFSEHGVYALCEPPR